ncbi:MAG: hypothetical protein JNJ93_08800 [Acinetobacter sp.]|nr:hypothetical protein [Acinetobacter sp.]
MAAFSPAAFAFAAGSAYAADEKIEVTPTPKVTHQELAAIYVLSEICPNLVSDQAKFQQGYAKLAKEYLPKESSPVNALQQLSKQKSFSKILGEAQSDAAKAGAEKNKAICQELTTYAN